MRLGEAVAEIVDQAGGDAVRSLSEGGRVANANGAVSGEAGVPMTDGFGSAGERLHGVQSERYNSAIGQNRLGRRGADVRTGPGPVGLDKPASMFGGWGVYDVDPKTELIVTPNEEDPSALDMLSFATFLYENEAETGPLLEIPE